MTGSIEPLRVGIIGCGNVAEQRHLPALSRIPEAHVVAIADVDPARLQQVGQRFAIPRQHRDHEALLRDEDVNAVGICVPAQHHVPVALAALDAGKHILLEKPVALNLADCDRLIAAGQQASLKIAMGFNLRQHPLLRQARQTVEEQNRLGNLLLLQTALTSGNRQPDNMPAWRLRRETGGGVFVEQAVHHFDLWRFLLQTDIDEVFAIAKAEDQSASVTARTVTGLPVSAVFSDSTVDTDDVHIYGDKGHIHVACYRFDGIAWLSRGDFPGSPRVRAGEVVRSLRFIPHAIRSLRHGDDFSLTYQQEWQHFLACIRDNRQPACTLEDGRKALQIVLAAAASATTGQPVKVTDAPPTLFPF